MSDPVEVPEEIREQFQMWDAPPPLPPVKSAFVEAEPLRLGWLSRRIARKLVEGILPSAKTDAIQLPRAVEYVLGEIEGTLPHYSVPTRVGWRLGLLALQCFPLFLSPFWRPFTFLSIPQRQNLLNQWLSGQSSLRRNLARAVTLGPLILYYSNPKVWPQLGYPLDTWFKDRIQRRQEVLNALRHSVE